MDVDRPFGEMSPVAAAPLSLTAEQEYEVLSAAGRRVVATVCRQPGISTRDLLGDLAERSVAGAFVTLRHHGQLRACCGCLAKSLRLADALDQAALRSATADNRFASITPEELGDLDVDVWLLWGLRPVEALGESRLAAIEIGRHGVQVIDGCRRGLLLPSVAVDHGLDPRGFLEAVCDKAGLGRDAWQHDRTELMLFEGRAIHGRLPTSDAARPPARAGAFYPGEPDDIDRVLDHLLADAFRDAPARWPAVMVPHAGWIYSGRIAARTLAKVAFPSRVIVLAPRHWPRGATWAVMPRDRWQLPGGDVASDVALAERLAEGIDGLVLDDEAHAQEHSIEVQLPIVRRLAPEARVVGIVVGRQGGLEGLQRFGQQLAAVIRSLPEQPLLVISSDLNHEADEPTTRRLDQLALEALESLDPAHLYETVAHHHITMCGVGPAVIVLEALRQLEQLSRCELVAHATSADAGGGRQRCVGYAGLLFG